MGARSRMIRRAVLERDVSVGADDYGNPPAPTWQALAAPLPCYVWSQHKKAVVANHAPGQPGVVLVEDLRALFPLGADVRQGDRVSQFTDRLGNVIVSGPLLVETLQRRPDHQLAMLRRLH